MNKLKKQLIAVGLSAVTAVTMVSTVFADEETTNPNTQNQTTQIQTASETTTKSLNVKLLDLSNNNAILGTQTVNVNEGLQEYEEIGAIVKTVTVPDGYVIATEGKGSTSSYSVVKNDDYYNVGLAKLKTVTLNIVDGEGNVLSTQNISIQLDGTSERDLVWSEVSYNNLIPNGYEIGDVNNPQLVKNEDETYTLTVNKISYSTDTDKTQCNLTVAIDGRPTSATESFEVSSSMSYDAIKQYIYDTYYSKYATGETVASYSIEQTGDSYYCLKLNLYKERTYNLVIIKDGVQQEATTFTLTSNYRDDDAVYKYLQENYAPKGYDGTITKWVLDDASFSNGYDTYGFTLTKNKYAGEGERTYTLKIINTASNFVWDQWAGMDENVLKDAKVEYKTFEFDSSATKYEFVEYINKNFAPEGYQVYDPTVYYGTLTGDKYCTVSQMDENTWVMLGPNYQPAVSTDSAEYTIKYLDVDTNSYVSTETEGSDGVKTSVTSTATVYLESGKDKLTVSEINTLPTGYVFDGDSFETTSEGTDTGINKYSVTAKVKKGEWKTPVTVDYYVSNNGTLKYLSTKTGVAQDLDANNSGVVNYLKELTSIVPDGYVVSNLNKYGYFYYDRAKLNAMMQAGKADEISEEFNGTGWGSVGPDTFQAYSLHVSCYVEPVSTIVEEDTKNAATLDDSKAVNTLVDSLDKELKTKYDEAIVSGKEIKFVPTVTTANLDATSEEAVKAEASKSGYTSVEAFDITLAMNISGEKAGTITETSSPLTFKVTIPEDLKQSGRKFYVLRYHDGEVTKLDVSEDGTFTTDKFSVYMLVYEDIKDDADKGNKKDDSSDKKDDASKDDKKEDTSDEKKDDSNTSDKKEDSDKSNTDKTESDSSKTNLISTKDNKKTTTDAKKNKGVNTSTRTNSSLFVGFGALALTGAAIVGVLKKKNELD